MVIEASGLHWKRIAYTRVRDNNTPEGVKE